MQSLDIELQILQFLARSEQAGVRQHYDRDIAQATGLEIQIVQSHLNELKQHDFVKLLRSAGGPVKGAIIKVALTDLGRTRVELLRRAAEGQMSLPDSEKDILRYLARQGPAASMSAAAAEAGRTLGA